MFAQRLNEDQRRQLVRMAARMVTADRIIRDEELSALQDLVHETTVAGKNARGLNSSVFNDRRSRIIAGLELLLIAFVDGNFHVRESDLFRSLNSELHLVGGDVAAVWELAKRGADLLNDLDRLIATGGEDGADEGRE